MFSSKLTRVAHRATTISNATPSPAQRTASQCFATASQQRRPHQRRHSSSKASCPPDSSNKPAPAAENSTQASGPEKTPKRTSRLKRTQVEKTAKGKEEANQFAGLPTVPDTKNVGEKGKNLPEISNGTYTNLPSDFWLSTFFSLHHPLSLANPLPPPASEETFNSIFESKPQADVWENGNSAEKRPEDVIIALQDTIETLEGTGASQEEAGVRWEVLQESSSNNNNVKHLDGPPRPRTIDELVMQFRPFQPPPPPQAFPVETKAPEKKRARAAKPKNKHFRTTIDITESTAADGHRTYTASQTPLVQIPNPTESKTLDVSATTSRQPHQPFLQRAWRKHQAYLQSQRKSGLSVSAVHNPLRHVRRAPTPGLRKPQMRLISVKRQRKLKMKKHKYKKLMKRTRNLRRRLDRN